MSKVAIMADTTVQMTKEMADKHNIRLVPLYVVIDGKSYPEVEIDLDWFYGEMPKWKREGRLPTTSAPSVGDFLEAYHELSQQAEAVLDISLSSKFGATFSSAVQAKRLAEKETPHIPFEVFDTLTICVAQMFIALEAAKAAVISKSLPEVKEVASRMVKKVNYLIMSDDLSYLARGGRTHQASGWVGSQISNTMIMEVDAATDGEHKPLERHRTRRQALRRLIEIIGERSGNHRLHLAIIQAGALAEAEELREELFEHFHCVECYFRAALPIVALHGGLGSLKLGWWHED